MKPMLAKTYGPKFPHFPCLLQPKLNGVRALVQLCNFDIAIQSRDEKLWKYSVLQHLQEELKEFYKLLAGNYPRGSITKAPILDGELYVHGWRLQDINSAVAVNRKEKTDKTPSIQFHIFDVIPDLTTSFLDRWIPIYSNPDLRAFPHIRIVNTHPCESREVMTGYFNQYTATGYEGVMLRRDLPYALGETAHGTQFRSPSLWKHKQWEDGEFVCHSWVAGEGKASIGMGALVLETNDTAHRLFKVGTGFSDADRIAFAANPPVGKLVRVRYLELTADGIPFNPSFIAVL